MPEDLAFLLKEAVDRECGHLGGITETSGGTRPAEGGWSKKEELGHLIDSATNNHVRFVRASLEPEYRGAGYAQNGWVDLHGYHEMAWSELVEFWRRYNYVLAALVRRIPEERLQTPCTVGDGGAVTLRFLIEDYVLHMRHHLDHILEREKITAYSG